MSRWFRMYADAMRHPKVARLTDAQFRLWVELLSVACENDGTIPSAEDLKHMLKRRLDHLLRGLDDLIRASLIEPLGDGYAPHGWSKRQYKSDTSTDRVRKHRSKGNVSVTPPEAETEQAKACRARDAEIVSLAHDITAGTPLSSPDPGRIIENQTIVRSWIEAGADPDTIRTTVRDRLAATSSKPRTLRWFDGAVRDAIGRRTAEQSRVDEQSAALIDRIIGKKVA